LNDPINKAAANPKKQELYMDIFDGVSEAFGVKNITDGAKRLYRRNDNEGKKNKAKLAYENALSPEIRKGVELAREKYAQKMILRKTRMIESYTIPMLKRHMRNYDKLCNYETGLIEINKALKKAQKRQKIQPFTPKIDINMIKNKVESVTKQVEANEASDVKIDVNIIHAKESAETKSEQTDKKKTTDGSDETEDIGF
jgi:hypothetical protein